MKSCILTHPGFEDLAKEELTRFGVSVSGSGTSTVFFDSNKEQYLHVMRHSQLARRCLLHLGTFSDLKDVTFPTDFPYADIFTNNTFKIEVENVKGQENRIAIAKDVAGKLFEVLKGKNVEGTLELKEPAFFVVVFHTGTEYVIGIDFSVEELNIRQYRVFPHSGSFKGDHSFYVVAKSGYQPGSNLLVGFMKDGSFAIEAGLRTTGKPVREVDVSSFSFFADSKFSHKKYEMSGSIFAFDETTQNFLASRKNAKLASVQDDITFQKMSIEDLDVKYEKEQFDTAIFHITTKDESKINEIWYQLSYVMKKDGNVLFVTREKATLSISSKFELVSKGELAKGESVHLVWLCKKL